MISHLANQLGALHIRRNQEEDALSTKENYEMSPKEEPPKNIQVLSL